MCARHDLDLVTLHSGNGVCGVRGGAGRDECSLGEAVVGSSASDVGSTGGFAGLEFAFVELALWASRSSIETAVVGGRLGRGVMFEVGRGGGFECGGESDDRDVGDEGGLEGSVTSVARDVSDDARSVCGGGGLGGWV